MEYGGKGMKKYKVKPGFVVRLEKFGGMVLCGKTIEIIIINKVGYDILSCIKENSKTLNEIVNKLEIKYNVEKNQLYNDVADFLDNAIDGNFVVAE